MNRAVFCTTKNDRGFILRAVHLCRYLIVGLMCVAASACVRADGTPMLILRHARVDAGRLTMVITSQTVSAGYSGERFNLVGQYVVTMEIDPVSRQLRHLDTQVLDPGKGVGERGLLGPNGKTILAIDQCIISLSDNKAYSAGRLRYLARDDASGKWVERRAFDPAPFFVDRNLTKLLINEADGLSLYALPELRKSQVPDLAAFYKAIGSPWSQRPGAGLPDNRIDPPPDYSGLSSRNELGYATGRADGTYIYDQFIYSHEDRRLRKRHEGLDIEGHGQAVVIDTLYEGESWWLLCQSFGKGGGGERPIGMAVVSEDLKKVFAHIKPSQQIRQVVDGKAYSWNPEEHTVLYFDRIEDAAQSGQFEFGIWYYKPGENGADSFRTISVPVKSLFERADAGFVPLTK